MAMDKPFLAIEEQVELLARRGMKVDGQTGEVLLKEGYYAIVNGYKDPFIDKARSHEAGDDRYIRGTAFDDMYALFSFDRSLRGITFSYLIKAEAVVRSNVAYCFSDAHRSNDAYLDQDSYASRDEYVSGGGVSSAYRNELQGLLTILFNRKTRSNAEFVKHYREHYGLVPLWVLVNDLTFGNIEHFFNLMKPVEQRAVCRSIARATGRLGDKKLVFFSVDKARVGIESMVKFRNICAHDERLYCARVGGRKDIEYSKMVHFMERYLEEGDFSCFARKLVELCRVYLDSGPHASRLMETTGIAGLVDELRGVATRSA